MRQYVSQFFKNPHQVEVVAVVGLMIPFQLPESQPSERVGALG